MNRIIVLFLIVVMINGMLKNADLFSLYREGIKEAFSLIKPVFMTLLSLMVFVEMMRSSGFIEVLGGMLEP